MDKTQPLRGELNSSGVVPAAEPTASERTLGGTPSGHSKSDEQEHSLSPVGTAPSSDAATSGQTLNVTRNDNSGSNAPEHDLGPVASVPSTDAAASVQALGGTPDNQSESTSPKDETFSAHKPAEVPNVPIVALVVGGVLLALLSFFGTILAIEVTHRTGPLALGPTAFLLGPGTDGPVNIVQGPGAHTVVHSVFFQNGSHELSIEGHQNLMLVRAQLACGTAEVKVTSWVSSRKYVNDPEQTKNLLLASERAEEVERQLAIPNIKITFARTKWLSFKEILDQHWFTELDDKGKPLPTMESLNRRVDVEIASPCRSAVRTR